MDLLQEQHERWVGDQVIQWYNSRHGASYRFHGRAGEAPDLEYRDGDRALRVEVVTAYYDVEDAKFKWLDARKRPDAPNRWSGVNFEDSLVENINSAIEAKCEKSYGSNCALAICVLPPITAAEEMESLLAGVRVPPKNSFHGIYLYGEFPGPVGSSTLEKRVWQLA